MWDRNSHGGTRVKHADMWSERKGKVEEPEWNLWSIKEYLSMADLRKQINDNFDWNGNFKGNWVKKNNNKSRCKLKIIEEQDEEQCTEKCEERGMQRSEQYTGHHAT